MGLKEYKKKRNFRATTEPAGGKNTRKPGETHQFVVQKHAASRLHYDFRLEVAGVLKSWAVPKGFVYVKGEKRLAVEVEDHPVEYGSFEGTIPQGQYGGGTVMLWDNGTYTVEGEDPLSSLKAGKIILHLDGQKLKGEWTLVKINRAKSDKPEWLLIKTDADVKPVSKKKDDQSVVSGRTMAEIATNSKEVWESNRDPEPKKKLGKAPIKRAKSEKVKTESFFSELEDLELTKEKAKFLEPMKALLMDGVPPKGEWIYEVKWDGFRVLAVKSKGRIELFSRTGRVLTGDFAGVVTCLATVPGDEWTLDGEIVALDKAGKPSFQLLQNFKQSTNAVNHSEIMYYVFDFLQFGGKDLKTLPLNKRKALLEKLLKGTADPLRFSDALNGEPGELLQLVRQNALEGLIGKQQNSAYEAGKRSGKWIKLKVVHEQEFVIGGYTPPQGGRHFFGSIIVGYYKDEALQYASRVGTGFDEKTLKQLFTLFQKYKVVECPFEELPARGRWGQGFSPEQKRLTTWLKPQLIAQVKFLEWTDDGGLRHPVFLGLRDDKQAKDVVRERPSSTGPHFSTPRKL